VGVLELASFEAEIFDQSKTVLSKRQIYLLVACFEVAILGFAVQQPKWCHLPKGFLLTSMPYLYTTCCCFGLIVTLTPQRQALQDWTRYRRQQFLRKNFWNRALVRDLIWGKVALVAIALNLMIVSAILVPWIVFGLDQGELSALFSLVISFNLTLLYAVIAQLLVFPDSKQGLWLLAQWAL